MPTKRAHSIILGWNNYEMKEILNMIGEYILEIMPKSVLPIMQFYNIRFSSLRNVNIQH